MNLESTERLSEESVLELMRLTDLSLRVLRTQINRDGFNDGMNLGQVSGGRVARHIHVHVMPHWKGNTNFMPLLSQTKVMPEHLDAPSRKIKAGFTGATG